MLHKQQIDHISTTDKKLSDGRLQRATFGAGCFWGVEYNFATIEGVKETAVGYAGGSVEHPDYKLVCSGSTGHAEVVEVLYDPETVRYKDLVRAFFDMHDPTTPNRQGWDIGSQYRSVIFYHSEDQQSAALAVKQELEKAGAYERPIVTEVSPAPTFYKAEEYHQKYSFKNNRHACG